MAQTKPRRCPRCPVAGICLICGALAMAAVPFLQAQAGQPISDFQVPVVAVGTATVTATTAVFISVPDTIQDGVVHTAPSPKMWSIVKTTTAADGETPAGAEIVLPPIRSS